MTLEENTSSSSLRLEYTDHEQDRNQLSSYRDRGLTCNSADDDPSTTPTAWDAAIPTSGDTILVLTNVDHDTCLEETYERQNGVTNKGWGREAEDEDPANSSLELASSECSVSSSSSSLEVETVIKDYWNCNNCGNDSQRGPFCGQSGTTKKAAEDWLCTDCEYKNPGCHRFCGLCGQQQHNVCVFVFPSTPPEGSLTLAAAGGHSCMELVPGSWNKASSSHLQNEGPSASSKQQVQQFRKSHFSPSSRPPPKQQQHHQQQQRPQWKQQQQQPPPQSKGWSVSSSHFQSFQKQDFSLSCFKLPPPHSQQRRPYPQQQQQQQQQSKGWSCIACAFLNSDNSLFLGCAMCGTKRPSHQPAVVEQQ